MFAKLNVHHDLPVPRHGKEIYKFGKMIHGKFCGIAYYDLDARTSDRVLSMFPQELRHHFQVTLMHINIPFVPPHIDNEIKVVLNCYVKTAAATTKFYEMANNAPSIEKLPNQTDGMLLDEKDLREIGSFTAESGDTWVLDVKRPHSVTCGNSEERIAYCIMSSDLSYNKFYKILEKNQMIQNSSC